jgi:ABC-type multidrug transport system fused ATPase/permease subunit
MNDMKSRTASTDTDHSAKSNSKVLSSYYNSLLILKEDLQLAQSMRSRSMVLMAGGIGAGLVITVIAVVHPAVALFWAALPFVLACFAAKRYIRAGKAWRKIERRTEYYKRGIDRLTGAWQGRGRTGEEFARKNHLYQTDLNVIGEGSLFELLCTVRSEFGAERLADYLLEPVSLAESKSRQMSVQELRGSSSLREQMNLLGDFRSEDASFSTFKGWLSLPHLVCPRWLRPILLLSSGCSLLLGMGLLTHILVSGLTITVLGGMVGFQLTVAGIMARRVRPYIRQLRLLTNSFTVLQQGLRLFEQQRFSSPKLKELVSRIHSQRASEQLGKLEKLVRLFDQREKTQFQLLSYLLSAGTQLVLAVEDWRLGREKQFLDWVDAWAEFEALQAIAGYAYEEPDAIFPELLDGAPLFETTQLGHPLLDGDSCVRNDIAFNPRSQFYLITGSNMAGKSTILRTIGLNAVIAFAGGPIRALQAKLSSLAICSSLTLSDSLLDGRSKFLAEVTRLGETITLARSGRAVLFLIDEILSGTSSTDRTRSVASIVKALTDCGAVGAISTHDHSLCKIIYPSAGSGVLFHMESPVPDDPLLFDYLLKPGVSTNSSAEAILRMVGI